MSCRARELTHRLCMLSSRSRTGRPPAASSSRTRAAASVMPSMAVLPTIPPTTHSSGPRRPAQSRTLARIPSRSSVGSRGSSKAAWLPPRFRCTWPSTSPGITSSPASWCTSVPGPAVVAASAALPTATIRPSRTASASAHGRAGSWVHTRPPVTTRSAGPDAVVGWSICSSWGPRSRRPGRELLAQPVLLDLPGPGQGEGVDEAPVPRPLVRRQVLPTVVLEVVLRGAPSGRRPDERGDLLAPHRVGHPDDRDLGHPGVAEEHVLDLARVDVLAPADDHVLEPAGDPAVAALVHGRQVAGAQPPVGIDRGGGLRGGVEVAGHHVVAASPQLTDLARADRGAVGRVDDLDLGGGQRPAQGLGAV